MRNIFTPLLLLSFIATNAQDGTPDPSFGTNGLVSTYPNAPVTPDRQKVTVVSGDKILQTFTVSNGTNTDFGLVRYNSDGTLDNTFDGDGIVTTNFGGNDGATAMFVQADGKIVVAGYSITGGVGVFAVARYNVNGSPDNTFDTDGRLTTTIGTDDAAYAVSIQNDGKIVVGGRARVGTNYIFALTRYNTNGSLDNTFDTDGRVTTDLGVASGVDAIYSLVIQNDNRIVAAGSSFNGTSITYFAVARYNTNGSPDNTFEYDGNALTSLTGNGNDAAYAVTVQTDGKIVAAGGSFTGSTFDLGLVRYTSTGFLDNTFDGDGRVLTNLSHNGNEEIYAIAQQSNGKILVAGYTDYGFATQRDFVAGRYNSDGSLDGSFGTAGITLVDFGGDDVGYSLASQGLNLIVGGTSGTSLAIVRLLNSSMILPVSLTSFTAEKQGTGVQLTWETVNERQTDAFEIERSADGVNFTSIGTVTAAGNSSSVRNYTFTDAQPLQSINFYRLKIVNSDRSANYSRIVTVRFSGSAAITLQAFPNPVKNSLNLQFTVPAGQVRVQVLDVSGRMVKAIELKSTGTTLTTSIDMSGFRPGAYIIRVNEQSIKVMKD